MNYIIDSNVYHAITKLNTHSFFFNDFINNINRSYHTFYVCINSGGVKRKSRMGQKNHIVINIKHKIDHQKIKLHILKI